MYLSRAFQSYHSRANLIWPVGPFKASKPSQNAVHLKGKISFDIEYIGHKYHEGSNFLRVSPGPFLLSVKRWRKLLVWICPPFMGGGGILLVHFLT